MGYYRDLTAKKYKENNYTEDPVTLALCVCEEAGEIGKAVNMFHNPLFKPSDHAKSDSVKHEMEDLLTYLSALANSLNIDIDF